MMKSEKAMGEALKRVAKECQNDDIQAQMKKIKKEFIGKRVVGAPESAMRVLSMWLMKKSRKVTSVNTNMKDEHVSWPKTQQQLAQMDDDDKNVFATSVIDRYAARPPILGNMCLAKFSVNYNVTQAHDEFIDMQETDAHELSETEEYDLSTKIKRWSWIYAEKETRSNFMCYKIQNANTARKVLSCKINTYIN